MDEELTQLNLKLSRKWKLEADFERIKSWPPLYWPPEWREENPTRNDGISNGTISEGERRPPLTRKHLLAEPLRVNSSRGS